MPPLRLAIGVWGSMNKSLGMDNLWMRSVDRLETIRRACTMKAIPKKVETRIKSGLRAFAKILEGAPRQRM
jgi:hypothetical protein